MENDYASWKVEDCNTWLVWYVLLKGYPAEFVPGHASSTGPQEWVGLINPPRIDKVLVDLSIFLHRDNTFNYIYSSIKHCVHLFKRISKCVWKWGGYPPNGDFLTGKNMEKSQFRHGTTCFIYFMFGFSMKNNPAMKGYLQYPHGNPHKCSVLNHWSHLPKRSLSATSLSWEEMGARWAEDQFQLFMVYPLVNIQKAIENGPVEIVDLPS